jgi:hypothetical protein
MLGRMAAVSTGITQLRIVLDVALSWATLAYGGFTVAMVSVWRRDEVEIALGGQLIVLALLGFLWGGHRRALGAALLLVGLAAPVLALATAPLYWYGPVAPGGEAFWTSVGIGGAVGVPLLVLGAFVLTRVPGPMRRDDPWWFTPLRWAVQAGLWITVLAFRAGDWDQGVPLVYAGVALVLSGLLVVLPYRVGVTRRGLGLLLAGLGGTALAVVVVAQLLVGGHMSDDEALVGVVPALLVAVVGVVLAAISRDRGGRSTARRPGWRPRR